MFKMPCRRNRVSQVVSSLSCETPVQRQTFSSKNRHRAQAGVAKTEPSSLPRCPLHPERISRPGRLLQQKFNRRQRQSRGHPRPPAHCLPHRLPRHLHQQQPSLSELRFAPAERALPPRAPVAPVRLPRTGPASSPQLSAPSWRLCAPIAPDAPS
ncbi:uncharacterized protein SEPMUDRAFT_91238 [Sphaerulina musiva SO2202]|uniref:Uncharacterized protein n=1 Tax=Sphaerulina musiva (strain SO2202) TaxID=692275 RepID=M3D0W9_SPHMS|nr:uncharacterized protein SEPMUDRAFT_91238 [Sphaerulina musiva SO2202]EMF10138.1 hypothetical protein SEPMUDRAFT_91238 [Sphaerulina musiva SO2202]